MTQHLIFQHQFNPTPHEIKENCTGPLHLKAIVGFELFNQHKFWEAHEALETAWLEEPSITRGLYKGVLQAGVMYLQIQRNNFRGAMKMYERYKVWISPWPDQCRGLNVGKLRADAETVAETAKQTSHYDLSDFDYSLFKKLEWEN